MGDIIKIPQDIDLFYHNNFNIILNVITKPHLTYVFKSNTTYWFLLHILLVDVISYLLKDVIMSITNKCYLSTNLELFKIINSLTLDYYRL